MLFARAVMVALIGFLVTAAGTAPNEPQGEATLHAAAGASPAIADGGADTVITAGPVLPFHDDVSERADGEEARAASSLAELVAAIRRLPRLELTAEQRCMAAAIYWEAKGEPLHGQLAVAQVILNRVDSGRWATSVCGVVRQPRQFSFVRGGAWRSPVEGDAWGVAQALAVIAVSDSWRDVAGGATSFHATRVQPGWSKARVATIGNHIFYR